MNLQGVASGIIAAVNPLIPVTLQVSVGQAAQLADGTSPPAYATPGSFSGSIDGNVLTVSGISLGFLQVGQVLSDQTGALLPGTTITGLLTGLGAVGTYTVSRQQTVSSEAMTTSASALGQVQPITWRDYQQLDGLNLQGVRWKVYLSGEVDGLVRRESKGGDLVVLPAGARHAGTWLVTQVLEQWPDWVCAAVTYQNTQTAPAANAALDFLPFIPEVG